MLSHSMLTHMCHASTFQVTRRQASPISFDLPGDEYEVECVDGAVTEPVITAAAASFLEQFHRIL